MDRDDLIRLVWPEGAPDRDLVLLDALSPDRRGVVLDRLEAVLTAKDRPLSDAAAEAGLGRSAFFNLRRAWVERGLAGVVPGERREAVREPAAPKTELQLAAAKLLKERPGSRNVDLARRLLGVEPGRPGRPARGEARVGDGGNAGLVALQKAERIVQLERRALARDPKFLAEAYGVGLMVDLTAISVALTPEPLELAVVAMVLETASGLVLGTAAGRLAQAGRLERDALSAAIAFLEGHGADRAWAPGDRCDLSVVLPPGVDEGGIDTSALRDVVRDLEVGAAGGFGFGRHALQLVGPRMGRMVMNPRRTLLFDVDEFRRTRIAPEMTIEEMRATWLNEVARHNEPALEGLRAAGLVDAGGLARGRMFRAAATLREVLPA